ncbi:sensor histidine kinase [Nisaea sediminum]|uniref:sensor histidine kinase n=1 Tax=Nisaea sediminum TaxID=2775867 RepID=UPI0018684E9D|nr:sensor histidine kinase [Nisaea sediminum]
MSAITATISEEVPDFKDRRLLRYAFPCFVLLLVGSILALQSARYFDLSKQFKRSQFATEEAAGQARGLLAEKLRDLAADLEVVASYASVRQLVSGNLSARREVEAAFANFASAKEAIDQVRILGRSGFELIRVDRRNGVTKIAGTDRLQDKSARYYFSNSITLPAGGIYVSKLDLNVENGQIEVPWRPTLRLATPLADASGEVQGVLILQILATEFIDNVNLRRPGGTDPIQLLNSDGYWLAGRPPGELWSFMFDGDISLRALDPDLWRAMNASENGVFGFDGTHYAVDVLEPAALLAGLPRVTGVFSEDKGWIVLGAARDLRFADLWTLGDLPALFLAALASAGLSFFWGRMALARRIAEERKDMTEHELVRIERLASLGNLVAGIAHELNTPIGNAVTIASTLSERAKALDEAATSGRVSRTMLDECVGDFVDGSAVILRVLSHAGQLIQNFKQVAVDQTSEQRRTFHLAELVDDVASIIQPQFKHSSVRLDWKIASGLTLNSYPGPLGQVLMNLAVNGLVHGFDEEDAGRVEISARLAPKGRIEIRVSDDGKGIPDAYRQRIFEPFFTTRLGDGGTGLGLSICFNIVTGMLGGTIMVESQIGKGTMFVVTVPVNAPEPSVAAREGVPE